MHKFKELLVWKRAVKLSVKLYGLTKYFPDNEKFGLVSQINRCGVSIACNIAEGAGRNNKKEFKNFLGIATGSVYELETLLIIAKEINYIKNEDFEFLIPEVDEIQKMLYSLIKSLEQ